MKGLVVTKDLFDSNSEVQTWVYCAPIFISSTFSGTIFEHDSDLIPKKFDKKSVRNGTLTFISYKSEFFAVTCKHVFDALKTKQEEWKQQQNNKFGFDPPIEGFYFFSPIDKYQYHFNYKLTPVSEKTGVQSDIAIARINKHTIDRLNRKPIELNDMSQSARTGIASGYPEQQRSLKRGKKLNTFSPKFVACTATLQITGNGGLLIQDTLEDHKGLDVLSGMSGGPIIWSDSQNFGLAGIVREGLDIQPKEGQLMTEDGVWIHGERITPELFDEWLKEIPTLPELKDETKCLYIPTGMKK